MNALLVDASPSPHGAETVTFTVPEPLPCLGCRFDEVIHDDGSCCDGTGLAQPGDKVIVREPGCTGQCSPHTPEFVHELGCPAPLLGSTPARVVCAGTLVEQVPIYSADGTGPAGLLGGKQTGEYHVALSGVRWLDPPITEWHDDAGRGRATGLHAGVWTPVSILSTPCVCPDGLTAEVEAR